MQSFSKWLNETTLFTRKPPYIPNSESNRIGNGDKLTPGSNDRSYEPQQTAPSMNNGGLSSQQHKPTFKELLEKWKSERNQPTTDFTSNKGLGDRGMGHLGSSSFSRNPEKAGDNPTISHGIPVGEPSGMFEK